MLCNFHTHTNYCDGQASVRSIFDAALDSGLTQLGFSSHAPLPFPVSWSLTSEEEISKYLEDIYAVKKLTNGKIEIYSGLEADYIPGMTNEFRKIKEKFSLDYIIGSVHLVGISGSDHVWFIDGKQQFFDEGINKFFAGDGRKAAMMYFNQLKSMITTQEFDIIGHFDKIKMNNAERFFSEHEEWYLREISDVLDLLKQRDIIMEINTRGFYQGKTSGFYPSEHVIEMALEKEIKIVINSDAHNTHELILGFREVKGFLQKSGCEKIACRRNGAWIEADIKDLKF